MKVMKVMAMLAAAVLLLAPFCSAADAAGGAAAPSLTADDTGSKGAGVAADQNLDYLNDDDLDQAEIRDPFENGNRKVFRFNDGFYFQVAKPVATGYKKALPEDLRLSLRNFFDTLKAPARFGNCLLQANFTGAVTEFMRTTINILGGVGGLFDPATALDLPRQPEDFGQTLAVWGIGSGPYIVWPLLGPSSVRRTVGYVGDAFLDPFTLLGLDWWLPVVETPTRELNELSFRLGEYEAFKAAALDPYISMREAYAAFRQKQIESKANVEK